jgi:putative acyl-CoA dehydrogenase
MQNVVANLAVESEALMWMSMRLAYALHRSEEDRFEALLSRICTPVAKYWAYLVLDMLLPRVQGLC